MVDMEERRYAIVFKREVFKPVETEDESGHNEIHYESSAGKILILDGATLYFRTRWPSADKEEVVAFKKSILREIKAGRVKKAKAIVCNNCRKKVARVHEDGMMKVCIDCKIKASAERRNYNLSLIA